MPPAARAYTSASAIKLGNFRRQVGRSFLAFADTTHRLFVPAVMPKRLQILRRDCHQWSQSAVQPERDVAQLQANSHMTRSALCALSRCCRREKARGVTGVGLEKVAFVQSFQTRLRRAPPLFLPLGQMPSAAPKCSCPRDISLPI